MGYKEEVRVKNLKKWVRSFMHKYRIYIGYLFTDYWPYLCVCLKVVDDKVN